MNKNHRGDLYFDHRKQAICIIVLKSKKDGFPLRTVETKVQDFFNILKRQFHEAQLVHPEGIGHEISTEVPNPFEKQQFHRDLS